LDKVEDEFLKEPLKENPIMNTIVSLKHEIKSTIDLNDAIYERMVILIPYKSSEIV